MTPKLYELTDKLASFDSLMEPDENGEINITNDQIAEYLDLQSGLGEKAENTAKFIQNLTAEVDAVDAEIKRLTAFKRSRQNLVTRIKEYALWCLQTSGVKSIGEKPYSINRQRNSQPSVTVPDNVDFSRWDERFKRVKIEPDKKAIIDAWKNNEPIPANVEIEEGEHVRIR